MSLRLRAYCCGHSQCVMLITIISFVLRQRHHYVVTGQEEEWIEDCAAGDSEASHQIPLVLLDRATALNCTFKSTLARTSFVHFANGGPRQ